MMDDTKILSYTKDDRYTISGRCPNCNSQIAIHVSTDLLHTRTRSLTDEMKAEIIPLLGTMRDLHLAKKFGISASFVRNERIRRGIVGYNPIVDDGLWKVVDPLLPGYGDTAICRMTGIALHKIIKRRSKLGIPIPLKHEQIERKKKMFILHDQGVDMQTIAIATRVSRQYVEQVLIGERPA